MKLLNQREEVLVAKIKRKFKGDRCQDCGRLHPLENWTDQKQQFAFYVNRTGCTTAEAKVKLPLCRLCFFNTFGRKTW